MIAAVLPLAMACSQDAPSRPDTSPTGSSQSSGSDVLTISDREVTPGQVVEVSFEPPPQHDVWGVEGELWQERDGKWKRIAWTYGWAGKPQMTTIWPEESGVFEAIGFGGSASWMWRVPARLQAGTYELRKEWLPKAKPAPNRPVVTERAAFAVIEG